MFGMDGGSAGVLPASSGRFGNLDHGLQCVTLLPCLLPTTLCSCLTQGPVDGLRRQEGGSFLLGPVGGRGEAQIRKRCRYTLGHGLGSPGDSRRF